MNNHTKNKNTTKRKPTLKQRKKLKKEHGLSNSNAPAIQTLSVSSSRGPSILDTLLNVNATPKTTFRVSTASSANEELMQALESGTANVNIESIQEGHQHIEMDLGLGVFDYAPEDLNKIAIPEQEIVIGRAKSSSSDSDSNNSDTDEYDIQKVLLKLKSNRKNKDYGEDNADAFLIRKIRENTKLKNGNTDYINKKNAKPKIQVLD
ncbi:hypothetical protein HK100_009473 [Physocladia obscura]|uniref:Uncharacterized protein n=1 Tax=Physocladia obscura TaxID=109957 RepID=A0AAD5T4C3_9FUNG|nr:hypothetical protein HK100_009473 [Physocladia obscura]